MDKQLRLAQISKYAYKIIYKPKLFRFDRSKNKPPAVVDKMRRRLKKIIPMDDALVCLPKNEVIINKKIDKEGEMILPTQVIDHFIDQSSYRAVMNYCICRKSNTCKDFPKELGCLFLGEAARDIHPDLHTSVTKEEAKAHLKKCREKGLVHLTGRAKLDTLWLDISPHDKLYTVCNCCPCCCISLATPYVAPGLTDWFKKMPGVEVNVSEDCIGCEKCLDACIYEGIKMEEDHAVITDNCRACGRCAEQCPQEAIQISMGENSIQETIDLLATRVDVT